MASRIERVESAIKKDIIDIITYKVNNPKLGFLTITDVIVSSDFSHAKVLVSFYFDKDKKPGMDILNKARGYIRSELSHKLDIRRCPDITFELDNGYENEAKIEAALERGRKK